MTRGPLDPTDPGASSKELTALRARYRSARRGLSAESQQEHARCAAEHMDEVPMLADASIVGGYLANDGELDLSIVFERLFSTRKTVALPVVLLEERRITFYQHVPQQALSTGAYGIREPQRDHQIELARVDVLLTPLVAYDDDGHRLGMGGGYYDRALGALNEADRPVVIGVAHSVQRSADPLPRQAWDVPLDGVLTEHGWQPFNRRTHHGDS